MQCPTRCRVTTDTNTATAMETVDRTLVIILDISAVRMTTAMETVVRTLVIIMDITAVRPATATELPMVTMENSAVSRMADTVKVTEDIVNIKHAMNIIDEDKSGIIRNRLMYYIQ